VKAENSQAYLLGEIWDLNPRWVGPGHFDGLMNYPFRDAALGYLVQGSLTATEFARELGEIISAYPREHLLAHYLPLGSHDTERLRTACREDARRVRQAFVLQFVFPGIPGVYYGDEIGLAGGADPECRGAFPPDRSLWDHDLRNFVRSLIRLRKEHVALREGEYRTLFANDARGTYIALRHMGADALFLVLNASDDQRTIQVPVETAGWERGDRVHNYFDGESIALEGTDLQVVLEPRGAALYLRAE
jgi:glycosidase